MVDSNALELTFVKEVEELGCRKIVELCPGGRTLSETDYLGIFKLWSSYSNMLFLYRDRRVSELGIDFKQIDREWDWDNFIILQAFVGSLAYFSFPSLAYLPLWNTKGIFCCLILHMMISEPLYYWTHRIMHSQYLFNYHHWQHHSSKVTHPFTAGPATFLEHLMLCVIVGVPIIGTTLLGSGSMSMIYIYVLIFDFLRCLGHCNVEIIPYHLFKTFPFLRYLIYTPTDIAYFLPFAKEGINNQIEEAILRADRLGVEVVSLAALNKNEALNGGGTLFVNKHPNLRVRVVHGNTLTAAVILKEIPQDAEEVFLTGATSKLGRAIALYLARRRVRVLMLTLSTERFVSKGSPSGLPEISGSSDKIPSCKKVQGLWYLANDGSLADIL